MVARAIGIPAEVSRKSYRSVTALTEESAITKELFSLEKPYAAALPVKQRRSRSPASACRTVTLKRPPRLVAAYRNAVPHDRTKVARSQAVTMVDAVQHPAEIQIASVWMQLGRRHRIVRQREVGRKLASAQVRATNTPPRGQTAVEHGEMLRLRIVGTGGIGQREMRLDLVGNIAQQGCGPRCRSSSMMVRRR